MGSKKIKLVDTPRYIAMEVLENIETRKSFSNIELDQALKKHKLILKDTGLITELVYGVTQRKYTLDYYLEPYIRKPEELEGWVRQLLRLSVYQLVYLDKVPAHAILNEAVEISKEKGHSGTSGFVNAVLRNIQRDGIRTFDKIKNPIKKLSIEYSVPEWLVEKYTKELGEEEARKLFSSLLHTSKASLRVNTNINTVEECEDILHKKGLTVSKSSLSPVGLVGDSGHFAASALFKRGGITIQDETSMLVAPALQVQENHLVLDACAAPGGKTTHIAAYLSEEAGGKVIALDLHEKKLRFVETNAKRLHVEKVIETRAMDARNVRKEYASETFDRILVDAPCSGLGLMRRKPDIKYTKTEEDILSLSQIQKDILDSVSESLKVNGLLVYSTCTITHEENEDVITHFLNTHPEFELHEVSAPKLDSKSVKNKVVKIYPHDYQTDGFFIACLKKTTNS